MKRIISVLMLVCLLMSLGTVSAFAANEVTVINDDQLAGALQGAYDTIVLDGAGPFNLFYPNHAVTVKFNSAVSNVKLPADFENGGMLTVVDISGGVAPIADEDETGSGEGYVARVGSEYFTDLQEAFNYVMLNGGEIVMLDNVDLNDSLVVGGGTAVTTAAALIAALEKGGTIELGADISYDSTSNGVGLVINKAVTINGNGHTLTYTGKPYTDSDGVARCRAINVKTNEKVEINNLTVMAPQAERGFNIITLPATLVLNEVNVTCANYAVNVATSGAGCAVSINGGAYSGLNVLSINAKSTTFAVSGATLTTTDNNSREDYKTIAVSDSAQGTRISLSNHTKLIYTGSEIGTGVNFSNGTTEANSTVLKDDGTTEWGASPSESHPVAKIVYGNYYLSYRTLEDAFAKAISGETVVLLNDVDLNGAVINIPDGVTLDENNHNIINGVIVKNGEVTVAPIDNIDAPIKIEKTADGEPVKVELAEPVDKLTKAPGCDSIVKLAPGASIRITHAAGNEVKGTASELAAMRKLVPASYCVSQGSILIKDAHDLSGGTVCETCGVNAASPSTGGYVPATGDMSNMPLWTILFIGFAAVALLTKKKKA